MEFYRNLTESFCWETARASLAGLPGGGLNIAYEALDRHVAAGRSDSVAIRWIPRSGAPLDLTFGDLTKRTNRFASALDRLDTIDRLDHLGGASGGPTEGDRHRVATLLGRVPALYEAALGTLKSGGVYTPLFAAFGPDPITMRLRLGRIGVLITTATAYRRKIATRRAELPELRHVVLVGGGADRFDDPSVIDFDTMMERGSEDYEIRATSSEDRALLHFTSGTTGEPKGAVHVHEAVVAHAATGRIVLELEPDVVYWCTADPGWVTGTSYGIISPLVNGATSIVDEADFDPERWYRILQDQRVNVFYTAPTALRMLKRVGSDAAKEFDLSALRLVASVGEPLDPETVEWARRAFGVPVLDNWWQTETGGIMIANYRSEPVRPGSMGRPMPGITAALLEVDDEGELRADADGNPVEVTENDVVGELAIESGWPSMFRGYLDQDERYAQSFAGRWYHSGDLARRDEDGYFWFVGRNNDVIKSAGHLIGPFEVESALTDHPGVVEAAAIGKPDPTAGSIVKVFVVLARGFEPTDDLRSELIGHGRKRLGAAVAPREIDFVADLPHTRSGKIMRRLLKARELGLDEGDTSTLEVTS